jgi:hypothetical protein
VEGVVIILGERMGLWGDVVLSRSPMGFRSPTDA